MTNRIGVNNKLIMHEWRSLRLSSVTPRDLCCFHLHKEEEALITLKMYGMDSVTEEVKVEPKDALPSSLEEMDSFIQKATRKLRLQGRMRRGDFARRMSPTIRFTRVRLTRSVPSEERWSAIRDVDA